MVSGYMIKTPVRLRDLASIPGLRVEVWFGDADGNGITAFGTTDMDKIDRFERTMGNKAGGILQRIADYTGQVVFSDVPENYGEDPLYVPAHPDRRSNSHDPDRARRDREIVKRQKRLRSLYPPPDDGNYVLCSDLRRVEPSPE
jgi:hypothetical protein